MAANISKPTDLVKFKALDYSFRVKNADTGDFIKYTPGKCNSCGACVLVCAASLWSLPTGKKARLSSKYKERCLECAACYAVCEQDAIDFRYPAGGTGIIIKHG
jgi:ferredoxin-like protein FixX